MTSRDFAFWLQGLFELANPKTLDEKQTELVRRHLALVFKHDIDPGAGSAEHQVELDKIHAGDVGSGPKPVLPNIPHWDHWYPHDIGGPNIRC